MPDAAYSVWLISTQARPSQTPQNRTQRASWTRHRSKIHPLIICTRCGWIQLSVCNSCHLSSFTLWFAATLRWRKLLVEEKSHIQSYPCGTCFPCISRVLSAVLWARSRVSSVGGKLTSHSTLTPTFPPQSYDLIESLGNGVSVAGLCLEVTSVHAPSSRDPSLDYR